MAKQIELKASLRERVGKGAAQAARRAGLVPGVVYGDKRTPEPISIVASDLTKPYGTGRFLSTVVMLDVNGKKQRVLPRDVQVDPVMDFVTHVDFLRIAEGAQVRVGVAVHFRNHEKSPGLKRGGVLNVVRHEVEFYCDPDNIPDEIMVDLDALEIGDSVHISAVQLPAGIRPVIQDRDFTIATIAGAVAEVEAKTTVEGEVAEGAEAAAGAAGAAAPAADAAGGKKADAKKDAKG